MEGIGIVPGVKAGDERLVYRLIGIASEIHRTLGPDLLEAIYEHALAFELEACGLQFRSQLPVDVDYKGVRLGIGFRADIVIEGALVLEVKAARNFDPIHSPAHYLFKLLRIKRGLLLNFHALPMKNGIKRISI